VPVDAAVGLSLDGPAEFVDEAVVDPAEHAAVVEISVAIVRPGVDVVGAALADTAAAAGEAAAAVAVAHRAPLRFGEEASGAADVEDFVVFADEDPAEFAVAAQALHGVDIERQATVGLAEPGFDAGESRD